MTGAKGFAGELGHVTVDPTGSECRCGKRGCLETIASDPAILAACRDRAGGVADLDRLAAAVAQGDPVVDGALRDVGAALGRVLGAAAVTLNPDEVVIGGEITRVAYVARSRWATCDHGHRTAHTDAGTWLVGRANSGSG